MRLTDSGREIEHPRFPRAAAVDFPLEALMVVASQLRTGMAIRFEGQTWKVVAAEYHPGQGKMGGVTHARLQNLGTGTFREHSFRSDLKMEDIPLEKKAVDFLYHDGNDCWFMDPGTFEQFPVPASLIGPRAQLLQPDMRVSVEFLGERPISAQLPDALEVRVADTAPPTHQQQDSTWKPARLESGVEVSVPQFIKTGDVIRLDVAQLKYMDRARGANK